MKKIVSIVLLIFLSVTNIFSYEDLNDFEKQVLDFGGDNTCKGIEESDIPTIFIPGILASWYSEEGYKDTKIKRWIPDPITHAYNTLFNTFKENGYDLKDVYYLNEFNLYIDGNPKQSMYLFGYDWKKDNKITAKLLSNLITKIRVKYEQENDCDIETVNIVAHSMGGLVARTMLSDMCASDNAVKSFYNRKGLRKGELKDFVSTKCNNFTKINNLITISTPQRGAPSSFPLWTKGNINQTDSFMKATVLKQQLGIYSNEDMYKIIHGYDDKIPNGIVTIGQLLPDVKNKNTFNNQLLYLEQKDNKIKNRNYPVNDFLEELNSSKKINKMFSNISGKYTMFYSGLTGNHEKNNIIGYELVEYYKEYNYSERFKDNTSSYRGKGLYDFFAEQDKNIIYNIRSNIRDEKGLGGDGTVPTKNLLLVENDVYSAKMVKNDKFKDIKIQCFDNTLIQKGYDELKEIENQLTKKLGKTGLELCSHTKMPILTSVQVLEKVSGKKILIEKDIKKREKEEQQLLYKYLGYADYKAEKTIINYRKSIVGSIKIESTYDVGLKNNFKVENIFEKNYNKLFKNQEEINNFIKYKNNDDVKRKKLDFGGKIIDLIRYEVQSPINLIIEDELGRKIGIDPDTGMIINEIPGAWTSGDTEGSNEPEFFLIPRTGTGQIMHKIHSYPTGNGEYHIVMNVIKNTPLTGGIGLRDEKDVGFVIAGDAKMGVKEKYIVGIKKGGAGYKKVDAEIEDILKEDELKKKYGEIFEKLIDIIERKFNEKQKDQLREKLLKFQLVGYGKFSENERVVYLIGELIEYLE